MERKDQPVVERVRRQADALTTAERRVAELLLAAPDQVAFGTVAQVSEAAGAGGATVVRLAIKLGFDGYTDLQDAVRADLVGRLRPAAERIKTQRGGDRLAGHLATETNNLRNTLEAIDPVILQRAVGRLADPQRPIVVVSGDASAGIARHAAAELTLLRPGVMCLDGNEVAVRRDLALQPPAATLLVIDLRRYDRWIIEVTEEAARRGWSVLAVTDSHLSPLAAAATEPFVVSAGAVGPFDSHVGILALLGLLVAETAVHLAASASDRLDAVEDSWAGAGVLVDSTGN